MTNLPEILPQNCPATTSFSIPTQLRPDVAKRLQDWTATLKLPSSGGRYLSPDDTPSEDQRAFLVRRVTAIEAWCQPIDPGALRVELQKTLGSLSPEVTSQVDADFAIQMRADIIGHMPAFAVIAACRDFLTRKRGNGWRPDPGALLLAAEDHLVPIAREKHQIGAVLKAISAPAEQPEDVRAANVAKFAALVADLKATTENRPRRAGASIEDVSRPQAEALLAAQQLHERVMSNTPDPRPMPPASPSLIKALANKGIHLEPKRESAA